jgi:hypothetical protein
MPHATGKPLFSEQAPEKITAGPKKSKKQGEEMIPP